MLQTVQMDADAENPVPEHEIEPWIVALVQLVAKWTGCDKGMWRMEFEMQHGHLRRWFLHRGPGGKDDLAAVVEGNAVH
jgi:hypothetical protein